MPTAPNRLMILNHIKEHLASMKQWADSKNYDYAYQSQAKAESLIELLEVNDCGQMGGFDKNQPHTHNLKDRYKWLLGKYPNK
jgi:acyl-CoA-binding protein